MASKENSELDEGEVQVKPGIFVRFKKQAKEANELEKSIDVSVSYTRSAEIKIQDGIYFTRSPTSTAPRYGPAKGAFDVAENLLKSESREFVEEVVAQISDAPPQSEIEDHICRLENSIYHLVCLGFLLSSSFFFWDLLIEVLRSGG